MLHDHCLSLGRGGGHPIGARSEGGSSAPLEAMRGRGSGDLRRISGAGLATAARASAGYRVHQHEVERCESLSVGGVRNTATSTMRSMV